MRRVPALALALAIVAASAPAHADDTKRPGVALGLSVAGTGAGFLLVVGLVGSEAEPALILPATGLALVGPSLGHFYTGDYDLALGGLALRTIGLVMIGEGRGDCDPDAVSDSLDDCARINTIPALATAGTILLVGTALAEIIDAPLAARRHNRSLAVAPLAGNGKYGVVLGGTF